MTPYALPVQVVGNYLLDACGQEMAHLLDASEEQKAFLVKCINDHHTLIQALKQATHLAHSQQNADLFKIVTRTLEKTK
jgi:hypothetical protein